MCPDRQILSALVDGEVPPPWDEKLLRHVESCVECSKIVQDYRVVSSRLAADPGPDSEVSREAVWSRLVESSQHKRTQPLLRTRFSIPLPVAVAALLVVAVLSTLVVGVRRENAALRMAVFAASEVTPTANQPTSLESVLQFLGTQDPRVTVTIQLPPGTGVQTYGKPVFMKASNLSPLIEDEGR